MTRLLHPTLPLTLAALVALGAVGSDRFWPASRQTAAKDPGKDAARPAQAAPAERRHSAVLALALALALARARRRAADAVPAAAASARA